MKAPLHLSKEAQSWFESVTRDYDLEPHHLKLLTLAGEAWDRCQTAREAIQEHGLTYFDGNGFPRKRPEVNIELDSRAAFARLVRELDLDVEAPKQPSRPPALASNRR